MAISQQRIIRFTVCMHPDHTLASVSSLYNDGDLTLISNHKGASLADLWYKEKERKGRS